MLTCAGSTTWSELSEDGRRVTPALINGTSLYGWTEIGSLAGTNEASGSTKIGKVSEDCLEVRLFGVVVEVYVEDAKLWCVGRDIQTE